MSNITNRPITIIMILVTLNAAEIKDCVGLVLQDTTFVY